MSVQQSDGELDFEEWGDGEVVIHSGDDTGAWVKYDPEDPMLQLENWQ